MARPAGNADRLMLAAGKELAKEKGCSGLKTREVTARAGVNLGMFHYHFKTQKRFTHLLLQEMYENFFSRLSLASSDGRHSIDRLRNSLILICRFIRDERALLTALMKDVVNGDPEVQRFVRANLPRHIGVLRDLFEKCQQEGSLPAIPFSQAVGFMMGGLNAPNIVVGFLEKGKSDSKIGAELKAALSDAAIETRVDMVINGIRAFHK